MIYSSMFSTSIALDIGAHTIKVVELQRTKNNLVCRQFHQFSLGEEPVWQQKDLQALGYNLKWHLANLGLSNKKAILAIKTQETVIRSLTFPRMPKKDLHKVMMHEIDDYLMVPKDKLVIDYQVVGEKDQQMTVLFAAVKKKLVEEYDTIARAAGLKLKALDIEVMALLRTLTFLQGDEFDQKNHTHHGLTLTLDGGTNSITLLFSEGCEYVFSRSLLMQRDPVWVREKLKFEIDRSLEYIGTLKESPIQLKDVFVTGGSFLDSELVNSVKSILGISPKVLDVFSKLPVQSVHNSDGERHFAGVAVGLALRRWY